MYWKSDNAEPKKGAVSPQTSSSNQGMVNADYSLLEFLEYCTNPSTLPPFQKAEFPEQQSHQHSTIPRNFSLASDPSDTFITGEVDPLLLRDEVTLPTCYPGKASLPSFPSSLETVTAFDQLRNGSFSSHQGHQTLQDAYFHGFRETETAMAASGMHLLQGNGTSFGLQEEVIWNPSFSMDEQAQQQPTVEQTLTISLDGPLVKDSLVSQPSHGSNSIVYSSPLEPYSSAHTEIDNSSVLSRQLTDETDAVASDDDWWRLPAGSFAHAVTSATSSGSQNSQQPRSGTSVSSGSFLAASRAISSAETVISGGSSFLPELDCELPIPSSSSSSSQVPPQSHQRSRKLPGSSHDSVRRMAAEKLAEIVKRRRTATGTIQEASADSVTLPPASQPSGPFQDIFRPLPLLEHSTSPVPRFNFPVAKEAILRSLGVDTRQVAHAWTPVIGAWEDKTRIQDCLPPQILKNTVFALAEATATDEMEKVQLLSGFLKEETAPEGSAIQRLSFIYRDALLARRDSKAVGHYVEPLVITAEEEFSLWEFVRNLPCLQFWMEGIAGTIFETLNQYDSIHIVDFGMWAGQWKSLLRQLAKRPGGPPHVRLTVIFAPPGTPNGLGPVVRPDIFEQPLLEAAEASGLPFEFRSLVCSMEDFRAPMVEVREGEAVAVNCAMRLAQLMDSSVVRWSPRDAFLQTLRDLNPHVITAAELDLNSNSPFFMSRIRDSFEIYSLFFHGHDKIPHNSRDGLCSFEQKIMHREIFNLVGCEGSNRVVRHERPSKWQSRFWKAGFTNHRFSPELVRFLQSAARKRGGRTDVNVGDANALQYCVNGRPAGYVMAWKPFIRAMRREPGSQSNRS